ncbi:hypothetical protein Syun_016571 [Stephania yunnanensis]|uniref:Transmembrane 9 superfamily member n=1 Tax=Stephania yunnanensis TaxID=152371 RepID=A0AAP0J5H6_9MAGN
MADEIRFRRVALFFTIIIIAVLAMSSLRISGASQSDSRYVVGEDVALLVNKVGPFNNPSETYWFYNWPFCSPDQLTKKEESLGEVLNGDRLTNSLYELKFRVVNNMQTLCNKNLTIDEVAKFRHAVRNDFYFKMLYDNLPLWGFIGKVEDFNFPDEPMLRYFLFTHVEFDVLYNEDQVIEVKALADPNYTVDITEDVETNVKFTYSVFWNAISTPFDKRVEKYLGPTVFQRIHWFSVINSLVLIILMAARLGILFIRTLKKDLIRCSAEEGGDTEEIDWSLLHRDVFRYPHFTSLFCAILGTGMQLLIFPCESTDYQYDLNLASFLLKVDLSWNFNIPLSWMCISQGSNEGTKVEVVNSVILAAFLYTGPLYLTFSALNTIAISYRATAAVPFGTILVIILIWLFVSIPLLLLGGLLGNAFRPNILSSYATKELPSEIPVLAWYVKSPCQICMAGFLLYFSIELDLHYVYASLWSHKIYTSTNFLLIKFILLILLTAMLGIYFTYLQLSAGDHRWWWRSVLNGGFTSVFVFSHSLRFYARSNMSGLMQLAFFIGYNACICFAFFLVLGTISFLASAIFVRRIYGVAKLE